MPFLSDICGILGTILSAFKRVTLLISGSYNPVSVSPFPHNAPPADTMHHKHTPQRLRSTALGFLANTVQFSLFLYPPHTHTHVHNQRNNIPRQASGMPVRGLPGDPHDTVSFLRAQCESISSSTGDNCYTRRNVHLSPVEGAGARLHNRVNRPEMPSPQAQACTCP